MDRVFTVIANSPIADRFREGSQELVSFFCAINGRRVRKPEPGRCDRCLRADYRLGAAGDQSCQVRLPRNKDSAGPSFENTRAEQKTSNVQVRIAIWCLSP